MKYKFNLKDAHEFGWEGIRGKAYSDINNFQGASAALFDVTGRHGKVKSSASNRVYLVLRGRGRFMIKDEIIAVEKTDVIIVPKNTPYEYEADEGEMLKLFLVHTPAFTPEKEVRLEQEPYL